jgi:hypothetical protein
VDLLIHSADCISVGYFEFGELLVFADKTIIKIGYILSLLALFDLGH